MNNYISPSPSPKKVDAEPVKRPLKNTHPKEPAKETVKEPEETFDSLLEKERVEEVRVEEVRVEEVRVDVSAKDLVKNEIVIPEIKPAKEKQIIEEKEKKEDKLFLNAELLPQKIDEKTNEKIDEKIQVKAEDFAALESSIITKDLPILSTDSSQKELLSDDPELISFLLDNQMHNQKKLSKIQVNDDASLITVSDERTFSPELKSETGIVTTVSTDSQGNAEMTFDLAGSGTTQTPSLFSSDGIVSPEVQEKSEFAKMLSNHVQTNAKDIVKTGSIVLKDRNAGEINVILRPESLGNVKIKLEISENVVSGKIIVASKEAYNAFNDNLSSLRQAFNDSGFDTAHLDLSWSGSAQDQSFNGSQDQSRDSTKNPFGRYYEDSLDLFDENDELVSIENGTDRNTYINITA